MSVGIEHGASGVAAGGVVGSDESHGQLAVFIGILAVVFLLPKFFEFGLHAVVVDVGVFLFHDALDGAVGGVVDGILGFESLHMAVGNTKGEVGIGEEVAVGILLHHALDVGTHEALDIVVGIGIGSTFLIVVAEVVGFGK